MLIGLVNRQVPIDLILFADTGAEHPHTYEHIEHVRKWLKERGLPDITVVEKCDKHGNRLTLEDECLQSGTLPSIAYGFKRCSLKHKIAPQDKFCNNYPPCREAWARGERITKFVGYDAGEMRRVLHVLERDAADPKYIKVYPLVEWGWTREDCVREIQEAGLPLPGKSSCFFCPSMKNEEIRHLQEHYPELFQQAIALEQNAFPNLKTVKGLGRHWSWNERFNAERSVTADESQSCQTERGTREELQQDRFAAGS